MKLETSLYEQIPVIKVIGDVDHYTGPSLADAVERALDGGGERIAFDLSSCAYMDSGGISILLALLQRVQPNGLIALVGADDHLRRVLQIVGLTLSPNVRFISSLDDLLELLPAHRD